MMITDQIAEERRSPPGAQQVQPGFAEVRARVTDLDRHARISIRQRPLVAVLVAVGVGYLTARLVSRAMR
jgi:hypothetical protein